jgi:hypothetical protein
MMMKARLFQARPKGVHVRAPEREYGLGAAAAVEHHGPGIVQPGEGGGGPGAPPCELARNAIAVVGWLAAKRVTT